MKNIASDLFEEALETGQTLVSQAKQISPGQIAKTAIGQVAGLPGQQAGSSKKSGEEKTGPVQAGLVKPEEIIEQLYGTKKPVNPQQIAQMKQADAVKKEEGISRTKAELQAIKLRRYQEMQQKILVEEHRREQEIPESEAGRPGAPRTWEEKAEMIEKQKKEDSLRQDGRVQPPSSPRTGPGVGSVIKQGLGSKEIKSGKLG